MNHCEIKVIQDTVSDGILRFSYFAENEFSNLQKHNTEIDSFDLVECCEKTILAYKGMLEDSDKNFIKDISKSSVHPGGWQSWSPSFEILPDQKQLPLKNTAVPQWNCYLTVPGTKPSYYKKQFILAQFITYFRQGNTYFVIASTGNVKDKNHSTPPVQYIIDRKNAKCKITVADLQKSYKKDELIAEITFFVAYSFEEAKEAIEKIFGSANPESPNYSARFDSTLHLGKLSQGWESWYNHYANIDEKLINEDLESITTTQNLISLNRKENNDPCVFQIDDGWEIALGDWNWNGERFPSKPEDIAKRIRDKGFIPGLWLAPFIIDKRSKTAQEHPDWLLHKANGKLVIAGMNPLWGAVKCNIFETLPASFYCLDLSNAGVLEYLDSLMNKVINIWGFEYIKLDFLYAGMLDGNFKNGGSAFEHYTKAVNILTKRKESSVGKKICYLGCGAPMEMSFNNFPLCRIGCDTKEHWEDSFSKRIKWNGRTSAYLNMHDTIGRNLWDKAVYLNDPDVLFIRRQNCSLDDEEKLLIAAVAFMFGSQMMYSDDPASSSSKEEIELAKKILDLKKQLYGKKYEALSVKDKVYSVREIGGSKKFILNLSDEKYLHGDKLIRHHSFMDMEI